MQTILRCLVAAFALIAAPAYAQDADWTDPTGAFSLSYAAEGWTLIDSADLEPGDGDVLLIEHNGFQASGRMRMCGVRSVVVPNAPRGMTQAQANLAITNRTQADVERVTRAPLTQFSRTELNGVAVATFAFENDGTLNFWRLFYLSQNGETRQVNISCGASTPANETESANINAVLATLQINGPPR